MAGHSTKAKIITEQLLRSWARCRRKAWLDRYGERNKRIWSAHRTLQLDHQHRSFVELISQMPERSIGNCEDGASFVLGLKLSGISPTGTALASNPPLIQKVNGVSKWGSFAYQPIITRQGHKLTREHKLTLSLNAYLLEKLQENKVNKAIAISLNNQNFNIEYMKVTPNLISQLLESIERLRKDLQSYEPPSLSLNKRKCSICSWKNLCHTKSISIGHLNEVSGIGPKRITMLGEIGIKNIKDLANSNAIELNNKLPEPNNKIAKELITQARVQVNNRKEKLNSEITLSELKDSKGIFLYDIEADPDDKHEFLHGFVKLNQINSGEWNLNKASYQPLLTFEKNNEYLLWERIKRKLENYPDWPILHYGETESISLYKLAKRNNSKDSELISIRNRCIDIHSILRRSWVLPINNYGLKSVANYIGFKWEQENIDGAKALLWWRQWKNSKRSSKVYSNNLNKILQYNKDDCLATWAIASWLLKEN